MSELVIDFSFDLLFKALDEAMLLLHANGVIVKTNSDARRQLGYSEKQL